MPRPRGEPTTVVRLTRRSIELLDAVRGPLSRSAWIEAQASAPAPQRRSEARLGASRSPSLDRFGKSA